MRRVRDQIFEGLTIARHSPRQSSGSSRWPWNDLRKVHQVETASHINEWALASELQPLK